MSYAQKASSNSEQKYHPQTYNSYKQFVLRPPRSFFKELFIGTHLGQCLIRMTNLKSVLKGMRRQEAERRDSSCCLLVPYGPVVDKIEDSVKKSSGKSFYVPRQDTDLSSSLGVWEK